MSTYVSGIGTAYRTLSYGSDNWKDLLTSVSYTDYSGNTKSGTLTYDAVGNPLTYFNGDKNWTFTWKYAKQLETATNGTNTITYTYDVDGVRQTKTVNGVEHKYVTLDGKVVRETYGDVTIDYFYDNAGRPYKIVVDENGTSYIGYFALDQQGDVIAILNASGTVLVEYVYDAWGAETVSEKNTAEGTKLYQYNSLKYRGYYYDAETGFYYVSSRYYDPVIGRFISADTTDVLTASPTSLTNKNLYAYCDNNPVKRTDSLGTFWIEAGVVAAGGVVGGLLGAVSAALTGGNVYESAIEGCINGAMGSLCGLQKVNPVAAGVIGCTIDVGVQMASYYIKNKSMSHFKLDIGQTVKTGAQMALGVAIPGIGEPTKNVIDAFGTALLWAEGSTLITFADVAVTSYRSNSKAKSVGTVSNRKKSSSNKIVCRISKGMTTADYFRQRYNFS